MFHVKHLLVATFLILQLGSLVCQGQGTVSLEQKPFVAGKSPYKELDQFLLSFPSLENLSSSEREMFYWVNRLRLDPARFGKEYLEPFLKQFSELRGTYAQSLIKDLAAAGAMNLVGPAAHLQQEAGRHARDLAQKQKILSHASSDGRSFQQRMSDAGIRNCAGENIYEGEEEPLKALLLLLIDQGVPNLGHRKALLNPVFNQMGVASVKASEDAYYMVQLFSCK